MPIYEYRCRSCSRLLEEIRDVKDADAPLSCPCGGSTARATFNVVHIRVGKSTAVNHGSQDHVFAPEHRCPLPSYAQHLTPDQYEAAHERRFAAAEKRARQQVRDGDMDPDHESIGKIPSAEFMARVKEKGVEAALDPAYWASKGRIYQHAKKRIKKTKD